MERAVFSPEGKNPFHSGPVVRDFKDSQDKVDPLNSEQESLKNKDKPQHFVNHVSCW